MDTSTTSRHVLRASEVLLWIPIKRGFVEFDEQIVSYATRLKLLLSAFFELRRVGSERDLTYSAGPIERLQTLYSVQWTVVEDENRLLVGASFDQSWESYFRALVDRTGALLDALFCHCEGFDGHSCSDDFARFLQFVRAAHKPVNLFYAGSPELTTDDTRLLRRLVQEVDRTQSAAPLASERVRSPVQVADHPAQADVQRALLGLHDMRKFYSDEVSFQVRAGDSQRQRSERDIFDEALSQLFHNEKQSLARIRDALPSSPDAAVASKEWVDSLLHLEDQRIAQLWTAPTPVALDDDALQRIQGGILRPYPATSHGAVVLLQCDSEAALRNMLGYAMKHTTSEWAAARNEMYKETWLNVALTYSALERLGLPNDVLEQLPKEFREGMTARAGLLGDVGDRDYIENPGVPRQGGDRHLPLESIDAVFVIQGEYDNVSADDTRWSSDDAHPILKVVDELRSLGRVQHVQWMQRRVGAPTREHFGYVDEDKADNRSQPVPMATLNGVALHDGAAPGDVVALGEILLGHADARGQIASCLHGQRNLLENGSFLVLRKLEQDVAAFRAYVTEQSRQAFGAVPEAEARFRASLVGRKDDGSSLVAVRGGAAPNDFKFADERACPAFAHARRSNPRNDDATTRAPRILRRSMSYGPGYRAADQAERGLVFMAYNASIAQQFEVLQSWINGGNQTGLLSVQKDIVAGQGKPSELGYHVHDPCSGQLRRFKPPPSSLVTLRWGAYLFAPSRTTLRQLAGQDAPDLKVRKVAAAPHVPANVEQGRAIIRRLRSIESTDVDAARKGWKQVLESGSDEAGPVWAAVLAEPGGLLPTPYGLLVAQLAAAREILQSDGSDFSVEPYQPRLDGTIGPRHYLALDRAGGEYARFANEANSFIHEQIAPTDAFSLAFQTASAILAGNVDTPIGVPQRREIKLRALAEQVIGNVCKVWFGLSSAEKLRALVFTSRYAFQVAPGDWVERKVEGQRKLIDAAPSSESPMGRHLAGKLPAAEIQLALDGAMVGFAAPAIATILSVLDGWFWDGSFQRLADAGKGTFQAAGHARAAELLLQPLLEALSKRAIPPLLYRKTQRALALGDTQLAKDTRVIVGLGVLYDQARGLPVPESWLFGGAYAGEQPAAQGGAYTGDRTSHGCPARNAALAVSIGVFAAVMSRVGVEQERRFVISYDS